MAHNFLQEPDWMEALQEEMFNLKQAANVSSIFIYQNGQDQNDLQAHKLLYINDNKKAKSKKNIHYRKHNLMRWKNKLEKSLLINGSIDDYDKSKTKLLDLFKINSLLILPIFVQNKWWGFLGIGDAEKETLETSNVGMLETAASIIGAAINNLYNLQSLQMSSAVFEHTMDGVLITDAHNNIVHVNDAFLDITGHSLDFVIGKNPKILRSGNHDKQFFQKLWHKLETEGYWQGEITNRKRNGEMFIEWLSINAIKNAQGKIENHIGIFSDVTHQRKDAETQMYLATHDPLTGLSNRLLFNDRLEHAISHAKRFQKCVSLIFCDLDNFKPINDTYGHTIGDEILKSVAISLKEILRKEDTICRFGGDEFVILVEELDDFSYLEKIVQKINSITHQPCVVNGFAIPIGMSIGASIYPDDGETPVVLLDAADSAMYRAKNAGKNRIEYAKADLKQYCLHPEAKALSYSI
jgi:diguanylate cyclase (GGDEF)-like protein/PAS domain S-box-containing protein